MNACARILWIYKNKQYKINRIKRRKSNAAMVSYLFNTLTTTTAAATPITKVQQALCSIGFSAPLCIFHVWFFSFDIDQLSSYWFAPYYRGERIEYTIPYSRTIFLFFFFKSFTGFWNCITYSKIWYTDGDERILICVPFTDIRFSLFRCVLVHTEQFGLHYTSTHSLRTMFCIRSKIPVLLFYLL